VPSLVTSKMKRLDMHRQLLNCVLVLKVQLSLTNCMSQRMEGAVHMRGKKKEKEKKKVSYNSVFTAVSSFFHSSDSADVLAMCFPKCH